MEDLCRICLENMLNLKPLNSIVEIGKSTFIPLSDVLKFITNNEFELRDNYPDNICEECEQLARASYSFLDRYKCSTKHLQNNVDVQEEIIHILPPLDIIPQSPEYTEEEVIEIENTKSNHENPSVENIITNYENTNNEGSDILQTFKCEDFSIENLHSDIDIKEEIIHIQPEYIEEESIGLEDINTIHENINTEEADYRSDEFIEEIKRNHENISNEVDNRLEESAFRIEESPEKYSSKHLQSKADVNEGIIHTLTSQENIQLPLSDYMNGQSIECGDIKIINEILDDNEYDLHELIKDLIPNQEDISTNETEYRLDKRSEDIQINQENMNAGKAENKLHKLIEDFEKTFKNIKSDKGKIQVFKCKECPKTYTSSSGLHCHVRKFHKGIQKKHKLCFICGSSVLSLSTHMRKHQERLWGCNLCDKRFYNKHNLQRHLIVHTDIKNFICCVCARAFNCKSNLEIHEKLHER